MHRPNKTFTAQEKEEICNSYRTAKYPEMQISILSDLNLCSEQSIEIVLYEAGLISKMPQSVDTKEPKSKRNSSNVRHVWTDAEIAELVDLKAQGKSADEIAEHFEVSPSSVCSQLHKYRDRVKARKAELDTNYAAVQDVELVSARLIDSTPIIPTSILMSDIVRALKRFQSLCASNINVETNALSFGIALGELSNEVSHLLERLESHGK